MDQAMILGTYQHYKGNYYKVLGTAKHSETLNTLVLYQALYGDFGMWVRPIEMFQEQVTIDGNKIPRFKFVN